MNYWWIALIVAAVAAIEAVIAWLIRNDRKTVMLVMITLASVLLTYKTIEFAYYRIARKGLYPVEFSHISYFVFAATACMGAKKMRAFAGICSVFAGFGYLIGAVFSPNSIVTEASAIVNIPISILQHEVLWFVGLLLLFNVDRYSIKEIWVSIVGVAVMVIFSVLVYNRIIYKDFVNRDKMIIIKIVTGKIAEYLTGPGNLSMVWQVITAVAMAIASAGLLVSFYFINEAAFKKREKNGRVIKHADYEVGILPLIKSLIEKRKKKELASESASAEREEITGE
ncbi:MAG: hypothetical protein K2G37_05885 [Clostridia bacterium]|nr:hypothetical protein [Clostridia bacterium]MDE7328944.1 hypothetical protein [Clostridia bacterium]